MNSPGFLIGLIGTLVIIVGLSVWFGTKKKKTSAKNSLPIVTGLLIGTLVGGSSTVGTAQLAYTYGMSAWWFTLGCGISCVILAVGYVKPFRKNGSSTLTGMIGKEYGAKAGITASVLNGLGTFINIISQIIAATAVLAVIFPNMGIIPEVIIAAVFMVVYVVIGGTKGAGAIGIVKTVLLYIAMMASGVMVLSMVGGVGSFTDMVKNISNPDNINFFSVFARGFGKDAGACLSLLFGVITTQTYAQAIITAKSDRIARAGTIISAVLIPPIGIGGILVGLYMRANAALYPAMTAKTALTSFVVAHMPGILAGIVLGGLFVTVVGTGAGLALGVSTIIKDNLLKNTKFVSNEKKSDGVQKVLITIVLALAACLSTGSLGDIILQYAFLSMGLRAAVVFCPLCAALFLPGKIKGVWALAAIITGPIVVFIGNLIGIAFDPLFLGIGAALVIMIIGFFVSKATKTNGK